MGRAARARRDLRSVTAPVLVMSAAKGADLPTRLSRASEQLHQASEHLAEVISEARAAGQTWDTIAQSTGLNRETLRRNYGSKS